MRGHAGQDGPKPAHIAGVVLYANFGSAIERRPHVKSAGCLSAEPGELPRQRQTRPDTQPPVSAAVSIHGFTISSALRTGTRACRPQRRSPAPPREGHRSRRRPAARGPPVRLVAAGVRRLFMRRHAGHEVVDGPRDLPPDRPFRVFDQVLSLGARCDSGGRDDRGRSGVLRGVSVRVRSRRGRLSPWRRTGCPGRTLAGQRPWLTRPAGSSGWRRLRR